MRPWICVAVTLAGCNSLLGIDQLTPTDAADDADDAPTDAPSTPLDAADAPPGQLCAMLVTQPYCYSPPPIGNETIGDVDTDSDVRCQYIPQDSGPMICAIAADVITVPTAARITGSKLLMLAATTSITISGPLDAGSTEGNSPRGPGANPVSESCTPANPGSNNSDGGGGGAGATFGGKGGDGGKGDGGGGGGGNGASASAIKPTVLLHAGCRGSAGGNSNSGAGGYGGGAIYLVAGTSITIADRVTANGAGGSGATDNSAGGGGGGSGGMIALDAPTITIEGGAAQVSANGGGGGEGAEDNTNGGDGHESADWDVRALGGTGGSSEGGNGGTGGTGTQTAAKGANGSKSGSGGSTKYGGGGGGGGGPGVVWIRGPSPIGNDAAQISPAPTYK